jgi:spore maturation protein CgeB
MPRFQKITTIYPEFEIAFRRRCLDYGSLGYGEIYEQLMAQFYGWSDYFAKNLRLRGYEAQENFVNFEVLQKAWAREHGVDYSRRNWLSEISLAQIRKYQPDILFLEDLYVSDADFRARAREVCRPALKIIGWRAAPTDDYTLLKDLDMVLTCAPVFTRALRQAGIKTELMAHGFEPTVLDCVPPADRDLDFTFIGMISLQNGFHQQRYSHVSKLIESTPLEVWGEISPAKLRNSKSQLMSQFAQHANRVMARLAARMELPPARKSQSAALDPLQQRYPQRFHSPVFGLENFRLLGRSRLTFNCHIDAAETSAGNARLFEATGMGTCLVTDWKTNLPQLFEPEKEVVTYRSIEECVERVNYLLNHEEERASIAAAGQERTLRDHTYEQRAAQLDLIMRSLMDESVRGARAHLITA